MWDIYLVWTHYEPTYVKNIYSLKVEDFVKHNNSIFNGLLIFIIKLMTIYLFFFYRNSYRILFYYSRRAFFPFYKLLFWYRNKISFIISSTLDIFWLETVSLLCPSTCRKKKTTIKKIFVLKNAMHQHRLFTSIFSLA